MLLEGFELNPVVNVTALIVFPAFLALLSYLGEGIRTTVRIRQLNTLPLTKSKINSNRCLNFWQRCVTLRPWQK